MMEKLKEFFKTDLGETILHCAAGAASGISWPTLICVSAWFHGREMGQHDDKISYISNPIAKPWVFCETYGPLACGLLVRIWIG